jgi:2-dehydro-3-deoxygluconokinase
VQETGFSDRAGGDATRIAVMGECMLELSHVDDDTLTLGYGGDVYNTAVSLARWGRASGTRVAFVSRVGDDHHSVAMREAWTAEGLDSALTDGLAGHAPGLYLIRTDPGGERSFTYWRDASPARRLLCDDAHAEHIRAGLAGTDWLFLSGITLSLLSDAAHDRLLGLLDALVAAGTRVAFDSNFRPAGWPDAETARRRMRGVLERAALALPTLDDEEALHGDAGWRDTLRRLERLGVEEAAVKLGAEGAVVLSSGAVDVVPAERDVDVVDTTGAGDAFDAGYLHARLAGLVPAAAARAGARLAAVVLGHRGAIAPAAAMPDPPGRRPAAAT